MRKKIQENKKKPKYFVCYTGIFLDNDESLNLSFYLRNLKSQDIFEQKIHKTPYKANFSLKMQINNFAGDILYIEEISKESEFLELAKEKKISGIIHHCPIDNFRMIALNESHKYEKSEDIVISKGTLFSTS